MRKRIICIFVILVLIASWPCPALMAADYDQEGYIAAQVMPEGAAQNYKALFKSQKIYLSVESITALSGYTSMSNSPGTVIFYRPMDGVTLVSCDGNRATAMGYTYDLKPIIKDGETYFDIEKILYLLHAQWCSTDNQLVVYPMQGNLFEFYSSNADYISSHSMTLEDLLMNGESKGSFALRTVWASVFGDFDIKAFYAPERIKDDYEEALMLLLSDDAAFLSADTQAAIDEIVKGSDFEQLQAPLNKAQSIAALPDTIDGYTEDIVEISKLFSSTDPRNNFSPWNHISGTNFAWLNAKGKELGAVSDALQVAGFWLKYNEILERSQSWGQDFLDQLTILSKIGDKEYGTNGGYIQQTAQRLLEEKADPVTAAYDHLVIEVVDLLYGKAIEQTPAGKLTSIITASMAVLETAPGINAKFELDDLMNTVNRLVHVEQIAQMESTDYYLRYTHMQALRTKEENDISARDWLLAAQLQKNSEHIDAQTIKNMRDAMMLYLRCSSRNKCFIYEQYEKLSQSYSTEKAETMRQDLYKTYAMLIELMNSAEYDPLLVLDKNFNTMYSDKAGKLRVAIPGEVFHEGEMPETLLSLDGEWECFADAPSGEKYIFLLHFSQPNTVIYKTGWRDSDWASIFSGHYTLDDETMTISLTDTEGQVTLKTKVHFVVSEDTLTLTTQSGDNLSYLFGMGIPMVFMKRMPTLDSEGVRISFSDIEKEKIVQLVSAANVSEGGPAVSFKHNDNIDDLMYVVGCNEQEETVDIFAHNLIEESIFQNYVYAIFGKRMNDSYKHIKDGHVVLLVYEFSDHCDFTINDFYDLGNGYYKIVGTASLYMYTDYEGTYAYTALVKQDNKAKYGYYLWSQIFE